MTIAAPMVACARPVFSSFASLSSRAASGSAEIDSVRAVKSAGIWSKPRSSDVAYPPTNGMINPPSAIPTDDHDAASSSRGSIFNPVCTIMKKMPSSASTRMLSVSASMMPSTAGPTSNPPINSPNTSGRRTSLNNLPVVQMTTIRMKSWKKSDIGRILTGSGNAERRMMDN